MERIIYLVKWDNDAADTYLYGTRLTFNGNGTLRYCNDMMPSGMVIRKWLSMTNYQRERMEPQLPLMEAGETMLVRVRMRTEPADTAMLRINFYSYNGELVNFTIIRGDEGNFTFPQGAYSYSMELVEAGAKEILFYRIEMIPDGEDPFDYAKYFEGSCDRRHPVSDYIYNPSPRSDALNILLPLQNKRMIRREDPDNLWNITNLILAPPDLSAPGVFFSDAFLRGEVWSTELSRYTKINFIACGRGSANAAYSLEYLFQGSDVIVVNRPEELEKLEL